MYEFDLSQWQDNQSLGSTNAQKRKLLVFVNAILCFIYVPLIFVNYFSGFYLPSFLDALFVSTLLLGSARMYHQQAAPPLTWVVLTLGLLAFSATLPIAYIGVRGTFWCFPIMISTAFLLPQALSIIVNGSVISLCIFYGYNSIHIGELTRLVTALIATAVLASVFAYKIRNMQNLLRLHSTTDPLTGAFNRRQLDGLLSDTIAMVKRGQGPAVLAIFDLDNFKQINDTLGHTAGDNAIIELVKVIKDSSRTTDLIFRLGGDEILLLLRETNIGNAQLILETIITKIRHSQPIQTTSSIGAAELQHNSASDWIESADQALYQAKQQGKNKIVIS